MLCTIAVDDGCWVGWSIVGYGFLSCRNYTAEINIKKICLLLAFLVWRFLCYYSCCFFFFFVYYYFPLYFYLKKFLFSFYYCITHVAAVAVRNSSINSSVFIQSNFVSVGVSSLCSPSAISPLLFIIKSMMVCWRRPIYSSGSCKTKTMGTIIIVVVAIVNGIHKKNIKEIFIFFC